MAEIAEENDLRYPVGRFVRPTTPMTAEDRAAVVAEIAAAPGAVRAAIAGLTPEQLDIPYRPGGWTVRQVVHHLPDSHLNAYVRFKLALTEDNPTVRPYDEARWAELPEARTAAPEVSLTLLENVHARWLLGIADLGPADWDRTLTNPQSGAYTIATLLALYAWHGRHHVGHITALRRREGW